MMSQTQAVLSEGQELEGSFLEATVTINKFETGLKGGDVFRRTYKRPLTKGEEFNLLNLEPLFYWNLALQTIRLCGRQKSCFKAATTE